MTDPELYTFLTMRDGSTLVMQGSRRVSLHPANGSEWFDYYTGKWFPSVAKTAKGAGK